MALYIEKIIFYKDWYLRQYPDIADAISVGMIESAQHHYLRFGYFEERRLYEILVDEKWYQANYPDIATAVQNKVVQSGQSHFANTGYREGRLPCDGFSFEFAETAQPGHDEFPVPLPKPEEKARTRK
jgi:hypothetical protein